MRWARKKSVRLRAWQLGQGTPKELEMIGKGRIVPLGDDRYEVFSREIRGQTGEIARRGDYFKVDSSDSPYPNARKSFEENHVHLQGDWYIQLARPVRIWTYGDPGCEPLEYLISRGILRIDPKHPERCFTASIWGTQETAAMDAVIVFYKVERDADGAIRRVDFNFVARDVFDATYELLPGDEDADGQA